MFIIYIYGIAYMFGGKNKEDSNTIKRVTGRGLFMPLQVANKGTRDSVKMIGDMVKGSNGGVFCPVCVNGHYHIVQKNETKGGANTPTVWVCDGCGHEITTKTNNAKELSNFVKQNAGELYRIGEEAGYIQPLDKQLSQRAVKRLLWRARFAWVLVCIILFALPFYLKNGGFLATFNVFLGAIFLITLALHASFSAFKIHNDLFYVKNHAELLLTWLKKCEYFNVWDYKPNK